MTKPEDDDIPKKDDGIILDEEENILDEEEDAEEELEKKKEDYQFDIESALCKMRKYTEEYAIPIMEKLTVQDLIDIVDVFEE